MKFDFNGIMIDENLSENIIKILITTDNHLGYKEKDSLRGDDSFITFEEILDLAVEKNVDFILLGGDLFHEAVPSQNTMYKCMRLLRRATLGDKPISLEFLCDENIPFVDSLNNTINYQDPNLNISIPIFSIHGNHDDPSGFAKLSALDILCTNGLINYFGKLTNPNQITINPILLRKGETQLALYGLSHIRDPRLARLFRDSKVIFERPPETSGKWFNLMVLHQNRADRGPTNYLPENILPDFLNLIIWGHEHDCRIEPEFNEQGFFICQPGSSVATNLSEGEAIPKQCGILEIRNNEFKMSKYVLKTVRPFIFRSIHMNDYIKEYHLDDVGAVEKVIKIAEKNIEEMITLANNQITGHPKQPILPLIRLRIFYTAEEQMFNMMRFGQKYSERIANPAECVTLKKCFKKIKGSVQDFDQSAMDNAAELQQNEDDVKVEDIVERYFNEVDDTKKLSVFQPKILSEVCYRLAERNDTDSAETILNSYKTNIVNYLMEKLPDEQNLPNEILNFKKNNSDLSFELILKQLDKTSLPLTKEIKIDDIYGVYSNNVLGITTDPKQTILQQKKVVKRTTTRGTGRGKAVNTARKPELDVTISNSVARQKTERTHPAEQSFSQMMQNARSSRSNQRTTKNKIVYEISDDSSE